MLNALFNQKLSKHLKIQWYRNTRKLLGNVGQDLKGTKVIDIDWAGVFIEYMQRDQLFGSTMFNTPQTRTVIHSLICSCSRTTQATSKARMKQASGRRYCAF